MSAGLSQPVCGHPQDGPGHSLGESRRGSFTDRSGRGRMLLTPSAPTSVWVWGSLWLPPGPAVSLGSWYGSQHPARGRPAPSRGNTEMPSESSLGGPALTPGPRLPASVSSQTQWALRQPTPTSSSAAPGTASELGDPRGFSRQAHEPRPHLLARDPLG